MPLSPDVLLDRIRLKRQIKRWRLIAILALAALLFFAAGQQAERKVAGPHVARITLTGFIDGNENQRQLFQNVLEDERSKALLLHVDSGGGTVVGGETLNALVRKVKEKKPVVVTMGDMATSGAYMVAAAADRIFAHRGSVTGAIGVMMEAPDVTGLMDKVGVKLGYIRSAPLKGQPSYFEPMSPETEKMVQGLVNDFFQVFVDIVAEGRNMPRAKVLPLADGRVFTGRQAVENKLVDAIGGREEALAWLEKEKGISASLPVQDVEIKRQQDDLVKWLLSYLPFNPLAGKEFSHHGLLSVW